MLFDCVTAECVVLKSFNFVSAHCKIKLKGVEEWKMVVTEERLMRERLMSLCESCNSEFELIVNERHNCFYNWVSAVVKYLNTHTPF